MMTKNEEFILGVALTDEKIASEIVVRVIPHTPEDPQEAQEFLNIIQTSPEEEQYLEERLIMNITNKDHAKEFVCKLNLIVRCLELQAINCKENNEQLKKIQNQIYPLSKKTTESLISLLTNKQIGYSIVDKINAAGNFAKNIPGAIE